MSRKKECIAMLLAGGRGSRLGVLTKTRAKPAVPFGGKYRLIDFALSNCTNSGIDTVGVLTQYQPHELSRYIGYGESWDLDRSDGGVQILPPYQHAEIYRGTANAVYQNIHFIDKFNPEYVIILSGDHIYKMDYSMMLNFHKLKKADCTISAIEVPKDQASRFGILNINDDNSIYEFEEKPIKPKSTLASMGIYIFTWKKLKGYLERDENRFDSSNDFGNDVIPAILNSGARVFAYPFSGYWRDVGTINSLWDAHMDLLKPNSEIDLCDPNWRIYSNSSVALLHNITNLTNINNSIVAAGCEISGDIFSSIIFPGVKIEKGAVVRNSIIMANTYISEKARINKSIIAENVFIGEESKVGFNSDKIVKPWGKITVIGDGVKIGRKAVVFPETILDGDLQEAEVV